MVVYQKKIFRFTELLVICAKEKQFGLEKIQIVQNHHPIVSYSDQGQGVHFFGPPAVGFGVGLVSVHRLVSSNNPRFQYGGS